MVPHLPEIQIVLGRCKYSLCTNGIHINSSPLLPHIHPSALMMEWSVKSTSFVVSVFPIVTFDSRIVRSCEPETMCWPSGENDTDLTQSVCPVKGPAAVSPVMAFHTRIVPSSEPETMCWPSGENATDLTQSVCPVKGPVAVSPVMAFHTRIVRSSEPETM